MFGPHASVNAGSRAKRTAGILHAVIVGALITLLGGCATATVSDVVSQQMLTARPSAVLVDVHAAPMADRVRARAAAEVSSKLRAALINRLTKAGIAAEPSAGGGSHSGAATLYVTITEADPGNAAEIFLIGFGLGRAKLLVRADLERAEAANAVSMITFNASSSSGYKLGLVVPGAVALATRNVVHLVVGGGIHVATNLQGGMSRPVGAITSAILNQLEKYYQQAGWM